MENLLNVLEEKLTPIAVKLEQNRYLSAVKNSFMAAMPLLIIGSFFILLAYLPITAYTNFMLSTFGDDWQRLFTIPNNISMSMMTLYVVIGIGNELAKSYGLDSMAGTFAALASFFVVTPMHAFADEGLGIGIPLGNLGAAGLFVGILISIIAIEIMRFTEKMGWQIKMPDSVPQNVSKSFSSLIPVALVIIFFNFVRIGFEQTSYGDVQTFIFNNLQTPLTALGSTLPATIVVLIIEGVLWSFGLHGASIVSSVMQPIWLTLTAENAAAVAAGQVIPNIVNYQFYSNFVKVGGSGATFGLCLLLLFAAKSKQFRALGKLSIGPEIFTINESIIFGMPIVLNPIMIVPFLLTPLILSIVAYFSMSTGLVPYTNGVNIPWTTPPVISGFLVSGWRGAVLNIVQIALSAAIYFPFFKIADNLAVKQELENEEEQQHQMEAVEA